VEIRDTLPRRKAMKASVQERAGVPKTEEVRLPRKSKAEDGHLLCIISIYFVYMPAGAGKMRIV
jgi:hypothetical protein